MCNSYSSLRVCNAAIYTCKCDISRDYFCGHIIVFADWPKNAKINCNWKLSTIYHIHLQIANIKVPKSQDKMYLQITLLHPTKANQHV